MILCFILIIIFSKTYPSFLTVKEGFFLPLRLSCKESSTFLTKPLFNGLYTPFGSPVCGGQKPQGREDVTALRCSEPLRYKVGGPSKVSPYCAGWDRLNHYLSFYPIVLMKDTPFWFSIILAALVLLIVIIVE